MIAQFLGEGRDVALPVALCQDAVLVAIEGEGAPTEPSGYVGDARRHAPYPQRDGEV